jgi:hypothetical protein
VRRSLLDLGRTERTYAGIWTFYKMERLMGADEDHNLRVIFEHADAVPIPICTEHNPPVHAGLKRALQIAAISVYSAKDHRRLSGIISTNADAIVDGLCTRGRTSAPAQPTSNIISQLEEFTREVLPQKRGRYDKTDYETTERYLLACLKIPFQIAWDFGSVVWHITRIARDSVYVNSIECEPFADEEHFKNDAAIKAVFLDPVAFRVETMLRMIIKGDRSEQSTPVLRRVKEWLIANEHGLEKHAYHLACALLFRDVEMQKYLHCIPLHDKYDPPDRPEELDSSVHRDTQLVLSTQQDDILKHYYEKMKKILYYHNRLPPRVNYSTGTESGYVMVMREMRSSARRRETTVSRTIDTHPKYTQKTKESAKRRLEIAELSHDKYLNPDQISDASIPFPADYNKHAVCTFGLLCYTIRVDILLMLAGNGT